MPYRNLRPIFLCGALLFCLGLVHAAQPASILPPPEPLPFIPTLRVRDAEQPVRLKTLAINAVIQGGFAEIGLDMVFYNPNGRVLEGELSFPLLAGQEISGLALDILGEMRNGVPVPKARGQEIFDNIARRNVDPALLEATQGNNYKLRVYPIPARGTRRVVVRVLQPLTERDGLFSLRLPLAFAKNIDEFSLEALVAADEPPRVESGSLGLVLERAGLLYRGRVEGANLSPEGWLDIGLPATEASAKSCNAVRWGDKVYFTATASVDVRVQERQLPDIVTLIWDASGSGRDRDHAKEYALLDRYFAALGDGQARVVVVRNAAEKPVEFAIRGGDWSEAKAFLHNLAYDGGTNLAAWKPTGDCAEYLLFTDGLANFCGARGDAPLPAMASGQRLYAITSSTSADHTLLRHAGDGRLIDLLRCDDDAAARLLLEDATAVRLAPEDLAGRGEALLDPLASRAEGSAKHMLCRVAGWIRVRDGSAGETVVLRVTHPDGTEESISLAVPTGKDVAAHAGEDAPLPARLWGRYAIAAMEANASRHKAAIERLGQELGIVSRETSLIVLETAADYVRYNVSPPASLKAEVETLRRHGEGASDGSPVYLPAGRLEGMWAEKVAWWEKDYSKAIKRLKSADSERRPMQMPRASVTGDALDARLFRQDRAEVPAEQFIAAPEPAVVPSASMALSRESADREFEMDMMTGGAEERSVARDSKSVDDGGAGESIGIAVQAWKSDAAYIGRMDRAAKEDMYAIYLDERPGYSRSSAFYLDMADRFFAAGMPELGLRVLSNLAEIEIENRQLLRVLAYRLLEAGEARLALGVLEKVRELAPYEPQSLRDLAVAHNALGEHGQAADLLYEVARRAWDERFSDINVIALTELNALLATAGKGIDAAAFDSRLIKNLPSDLRVVLTWDADNTDMDLWVTDPDGEKCDYSNRLTRQGGAMSRDCTGGYGPEEFMIKKANPGKYRVEVEYYGSGQQVLSGDVTLYITLTTGFGTSRQEERAVTMRLKGEKSRVLVGEFEVE